VPVNATACLPMRETRMLSRPPDRFTPLVRLIQPSARSFYTVWRGVRRSRLQLIDALPWPPAKRTRPMRLIGYLTFVYVLSIQCFHAPLLSLSSQTNVMVPSLFTFTLPSASNSRVKRAGPVKVSLPFATTPS
jgi:hypothetical protein